MSMRKCSRNAKGKGHGEPQKQIITLLFDFCEEMKPQHVMACPWLWHRLDKVQAMSQLLPKGYRPNVTGRHAYCTLTHWLYAYWNGAHRAV